MSGIERMHAVGRDNLQAGRQMLSDRRRIRIANLCDLVAEGVPVKAAAKVIGITETCAQNMMGQVKRELGWQAQ